ncbi:MAG TPA: 50S ribosomal protein L17 [Polyangiaceae bacterium]|nr:50S ribosomal protein L17 [Polyangiaceae bacterium]
MRHGNAGRKFDRNTSHRRAMLKNLAANLILHERIETTDAKAKELRRVAERLISRAKRLGAVAYTPQGELSDKDKARRLHAQRVVASLIPRFGVKVDNKQGTSTKVDLVEKIFVDLAKRFSERPGGYTRIVKVGPRRGDNAPISLIEWVDASGPGGGTESTDDDSGAAKTGKAKSKKATAVAGASGVKAE